MAGCGTNADLKSIIDVNNSSTDYQSTIISDNTQNSEITSSSDEANGSSENICNSSQDTNTSSEDTRVYLSVVNMDYFKSLSLDGIDNVSSMGIKKDSISERAPVQHANGILLKGPRLKETNNLSKKEKHYFFKSDKKHSNGDIEYEDNSVDKMTFKKDEDVVEDIYDENGDVINSTQVINQDDMSVQANKIFVAGEYTFIQFVPVVDESGTYYYKDSDNSVKSENIDIRPDSLTYDANGIASFDKGNYYSSVFTKSYAINNKTGSIFGINNFNIQGFKDGLIIGNDGNYYSAREVENNLLFEDVLPNKDIQINNVIKDKYGWIFVANDSIDDVDAENKLVYTTNKKLVYDSDMVVYETNYYQATLMTNLASEYVNGVLSAYNNNRFVKNIKNLFTNYADGNLHGKYYTHDISNLNVYGSDGILIVNTETTWVSFSTSVVQNLKWFDDYKFIIRRSDEGYLSYLNIDLDNLISTKQVLTESNMVALSDKKMDAVNDYYLDIGGSKYLLENVYCNKGISSTRYYQLVKVADALQLVELSSVEYSSNIFVMQQVG